MISHHRARRPAGLLAASALAVSLALTGCSATGADEPTRTAAQNGYVGGQQALTRVPPAQRKPAPVVSGVALGSDKTISTGDVAGKVLVLNVWGSWCAPCRQEAGALQAASVETAKEAQFIGINSRDTDPAPAEAFLRAFKVTYPSIYDNDGSVLLRFSGNLPLSTFPSTLIVDRQGRVAVRIAGPISKITLVDLVNDVAAGH